MIATGRGPRAAPGPWVWLSLAPFMLWSLYCLALGERRWELVAVLLALPLLASGGAGARKLYAGLYPIGLVGLVYDGMRFFKNVGLGGGVHLCDLRRAEVALFGVVVGGERTTVHELLQARATPALDLLCAVPYGTYIFVSLGCAVYLYRRDFMALQRFTWAFLLVNLAGFATYHLYPAAPPWYFHAHGCRVDLGAAASAGPNLARVDAMLGVDYFASLYGRSNDVFGAIPSLHVSYPLLILLEGYRHFGRLLRVAAVAFFLSMCFAAVYLDHHWVIDVALGLGLTLASHAAVCAAFGGLAVGRARSASADARRASREREGVGPLW